jgi:anti-anti-sigma factor
VNYSMKRDGAVVVITIHGSVWGELEDYQLKDEIKVQLGMGVRGFVLDFGDARRLNSMGIGIVIASLVSIRDKEGRLVVCGMNRRVHTTFEVAGILPILEVYPEAKDALAAAGEG